MPILVKHSGNVAPTAVGAFAGGKAKREVFEEEQAMTNIRQQRQISAAAREAAASRDFAAQQAEASRDFAAQQNELSRNAAADQAQAGRDFQQEMAVDASARAAAAAEANFDRETKAKQAEYTQKQRDEFNRLQDLRDKISQNPGLSDEEKQDMFLQIDAQQAGIKPLQRMKKPSEWPEGQGIGQTWSSEDGGAVFTRDSTGAVKKLYEPPSSKLTMQDTAKWAEAGMKALTVTKPDGKGGETASPPKPEELETWIEGMVKLTRRLNGEVEQEQPQMWDSAYNQQTVAAKFPPPEKPVITAEDTAQQARAKERAYATAMKDWKAANDARMRGEPVPEGGKPLVPGIAAEVAGVDRESPEMLSARAQLSEGRAALAKLRGGEQAPAAKPNVIKISTDAEYDGLASGTVFVGPDGVTRRKP